jgi:hypothetical protein
MPFQRTSDRGPPPTVNSQGHGWRSRCQCARRNKAQFRGTSPSSEAHDRPGHKVREEQLAGFGLTEAGHFTYIFERVNLRPRTRVLLQNCNPLTAKVPKKVEAIELWVARATIAIAADDGVTVVSDVLDLKDRWSERRVVTNELILAVALITLKNISAVVLAAAGGEGDKIDFFRPLMAYLADEDVSGFAIEAKAPRVAQTIDPDLAASEWHAYERVVWWDRVTARTVNINAKDRAVEAAEILGFGLNSATVSQPHVEHAV